MNTQEKEQLWRFHGGLKLDHFKRISTQQAIKKASLPKQLIIPLSQHLGNPSNPTIKIEDYVKAGELIAIADGEKSANIHAPTSGIIRAIKPHPIPHPSGLESPCIWLEPDGKDDWVELNHYQDPFKLTSKQIQQKIIQAGIVGLGGAAFPTHIKLAATKIETLIINGAECEPYISCDEMLMLERAEEIVMGTQIMQHALQAKLCILAIEDHRDETFQQLNNAIKKTEQKYKIANGIQLVRVPTIYPEGGEKQLIQVLTGKEVPINELSIDLGIICHNVATAANVYHAVCFDKPLTSTIVTITGKGVKQPQNIEALIGTPVNHLINIAGGYNDNVERIIMGGPMMGFALARDDIPVVKASNCLLALTAKEIRPTQVEMPCIRCMQCVDVCPAQLLPQQLFWHINANNLEMATQYHLDGCIECGCCAFVCPSHIPLVDYYRYAKTEIRHQENEKIKAAQAKSRYDDHKLRIEKQQQARQKRLEKKRQALLNTKQVNNNQKAKDAIAAAIARAEAKKQAKNQE